MLRCAWVFTVRAGGTRVFKSTEPDQLYLLFLGTVALNVSIKRPTALQSLFWSYGFSAIAAINSLFVSMNPPCLLFVHCLCRVSLPLSFISFFYAFFCLHVSFLRFFNFLCFFLLLPSFSVQQAKNRAFLARSPVLIQHKWNLSTNLLLVLFRTFRFLTKVWHI